MLGSWWELAFGSAMLALESQAVIGLRVAKLAAGGQAAGIEAQQMVSEKIVAAGEAALLVATGAPSQQILDGYRRKVRANRRRLSRGSARR